MLLELLPSKLVFPPHKVNPRCGSTLVDFLFVLSFWITCQTRSASSFVVNESVLNSFSPLSKSNSGVRSSILQELEDCGSAKRDYNPLAPIKYTSSISSGSDSRTSGWLSASVAGRGGRDSKSELPVFFPGLYSNVYVYALKISNQR